MITRKETLNEIATLKSKALPVGFIALVMNLAVSDVAEAIKAFKL